MYITATLISLLQVCFVAAKDEEVAFQYDYENSSEDTDEEIFLQNEEECMPQRRGGMPPSGMPPSGMPPSGMPPSGMPPSGMPPSGMPPEEMPPGGFPSRIQARRRYRIRRRKAQKRNTTNTERETEDLKDGRNTTRTRRPRRKTRSLHSYDLKQNFRKCKEYFEKFDLKYKSMKRRRQVGKCKGSIKNIERQECEFAEMMKVKDELLKTNTQLKLNPECSNEALMFYLLPDYVGESEVLV